MPSKPQQSESTVEPRIELLADSCDALRTFVGFSPNSYGQFCSFVAFGPFQGWAVSEQKTGLRGAGARISNVSAAKNLYDEAQKLSPEERSILALKLLDSVGESEESIERAWSVEIARRIEDIDAGRAKLSPWSEVKKRIFGT